MEYMSHYIDRRGERKVANNGLMMEIVAYRGKEDIDINRFILALNKTIYNHPVLLSRFHEEDDGEIYIDYRPDLPPEIKIINIRDEEIHNLKDKLLHIYNPFNSSLVNFTLFISNTSVYFYYDIFHSNFDGNSVAIFENNLELAYLNKPLPKDYFFLNLYHYNEKLKTKKYEDTVKFYKENFDLNREYCPKFDDDIPANIRNNGTLQLIYKEYSSKELRKQLREYFGDKPKYYNIFMTMNILLTDYIATRKPMVHTAVAHIMDNFTTLRSRS